MPSYEGHYYIDLCRQGRIQPPFQQDHDRLSRPRAEITHIGQDIVEAKSQLSLSREVDNITEALLAHEAGAVRDIVGKRFHQFGGFRDDGGILKVVPFRDKRAQVAAAAEVRIVGCGVSSRVDAFWHL